MKKIDLKISILAAVFMFSCITLSYADQTSSLSAKKLNQHYKKVKNSSQLLFIFSSSHASIKHIADNNYEITFKNVDKYVKYFSDRPQRNVGIIPLQTFLNDWDSGKNSFADVPPNAAINGKLKGQLKHVSYVFTLSEPQYDANTNSITFHAVLDNVEHHKTIATELDYNSVFIDFSWSNSM